MDVLSVLSGPNSPALCDMSAFAGVQDLVQTVKLGAYGQWYIAATGTAFQAATGTAFIPIPKTATGTAFSFSFPTAIAGIPS